MFTKFLNALGFQTKAQREADYQRLVEAIRQVKAMRTGNTGIQAVITTDQIPRRSKPRPTTPPSKPSGQVRSERYGFSDQDSYRNDFNALYAPSFYSGSDGGYSSGSSSCDSSSSSTSDSGSSSSGSCD